LREKIVFSYNQFSPLFFIESSTIAIQIKEEEEISLEEYEEEEEERNVTEDVIERVLITDT